VSPFDSGLSSSSPQLVDKQTTEGEFREYVLVFKLTTQAESPVQHVKIIWSRSLCKYSRTRRQKERIERNEIKFINLHTK